MLIYSLSSSGLKSFTNGQAAHDAAPAGNMAASATAPTPQLGGLNHRRVLSPAVGVEIETVTLFFTALALKLKSKLLERHIGESTSVVTLAHCFIQKQ